MFYTPDTRQLLIDRIGWADTIPPSTLSVSPENLKKDSGRTFDEFYRMASVESIAATINNSEANEDGLNAELKKLKDQAVSTILDKVFDSNDKAYYRESYGRRIDISGNDYSGIIAARPSLFDEAIGYSMACKVAEYILASGRINAEERSLQFNYTKIKSDLEGIRSEVSGKELTVGMYTKLYAAIGKIIKVLFPDTKTPALIGRRLW